MRLAILGVEQSVGCSLILSSDLKHRHVLGSDLGEEVREVVPRNHRIDGQRHRPSGYLLETTPCFIINFSLRGDVQGLGRGAKGRIPGR